MSGIDVVIEQNVIQQSEITISPPKHVVVEQIGGTAITVDQPPSAASSFDVQAPIVAQIVLPDVARVITSKEDATVISVVDKYSIVGISDQSADKSYVHVQSSPANPWIIDHGMSKFPAVSVVDSANSIVIGDVRYLNNNSLSVTFAGSFSGKAYLN